MLFVPAVKRLIVFLVAFCLIAPSQQFTTYQNRSCTIVGDADLYGIGVRLGFYCLAFSRMVAALFGNQKSTLETTKASLVLLLATLVISSTAHLVTVWYHSNGTSALA